MMTFFSDVESIVIPCHHFSPSCLIDLEACTNIYSCPLWSTMQKCIPLVLINNMKLTKLYWNSRFENILLKHFKDVPF